MLDDVQCRLDLIHLSHRPWKATAIHLEMTAEGTSWDGAVRPARVR